MPECYTHVYIAMQALMRSGHTVASRPAFIAGACGPDPFFMYRVFKNTRQPDLPALAARMHREKTGAFLQALVRHASTPAQQSYALGFITHYTTDCTLSPYIAAMSGHGAPYSGENGAVILATAIDSALYYQDYRTRLVPLHAGTPVLITDDLAQVCILLRESIAQVYELDIPLLVLADAFHDNYAARRRMVSRTGVKRLFLKMRRPYTAPDGPGPLWCRTQPGPRLRPLPATWVNPYSGHEMSLTLHEVVALAEQTGAVCVTAAMRSWLGTLGDEKLDAIFGNNDCHTGMPHKQDTTGKDSTQAAQGQEEAPQPVAAG